VGLVFVLDLLDQEIDVVVQHCRIEIDFHHQIDRDSLDLAFRIVQSSLDRKIAVIDQNGLDQGFLPLSFAAQMLSLLELSKGHKCPGVQILQILSDQFWIVFELALSAAHKFAVVHILRWSDGVVKGPRSYGIER
jgi:hypothetical protein